MSWSKDKITRRLMMAGLLAISGCGFRPMNADRHYKGLSDLRGNIGLPDAHTREQYAMRSELASYFGEGVDSSYQLSVSYASSVIGQKVRQVGDVSRIRVTGYGRYQLKRNADDQIVLDRPFRVVGAYGSGGGAVASRQAGIDAKEQVARKSGDLIARQVLVFLASGALAS